MNPHDAYEPDLFRTLRDETPDVTEETPTVLSSNWSIGPLLGRGCLLPQSWGEPSGLSIFDEESVERLVTCVGRIPTNWVEKIRNGELRNAFPIAIRVREPSESSDYLTLSDVEGFVFQDQSELDDFRHSPFSDVNIEALGLPLTVEPELFTGEPVDFSRGSGGVARQPELLRRADAIAAVKAVLPRISTADPSWAERFTLAWQKPNIEESAEGDWFEHIIRGAWGGEAAPSTYLGALLIGRFANLVVEQYPLSNGWPAEEILDNLLEALGAEPSLGAEDQETLKQWGEKTEAAIRAVGDIPRLSDDKGIEFRAVMYMLMRDGDLSQVLDSDRSEDGPLQVGEHVRTAAALLGALRSGLRSLTTEQKFPPGTQDAPVVNKWMSVLADGLISDLELSQTRPQLSVQEIEEDRKAISVGGEFLFRTPHVWARPDPAFEALCARFSWNVRPISFDDVICETDQEVELLFLSVGSQGQIAVSAIVKLHDLGAKKSTAKWPTPKARKIPKGTLLQMMEYSANPRLRGRVGLSPRHQALIYLAPLSISAADTNEAVLGSIEEIKLEAEKARSTFDSQS